MWRNLSIGLMAVSFLASSPANAEMQCGFGCFLKKNEKSINAAISYSGDISRTIPLPAAQLYGWGVYTLMNADEIYDRSKENSVSLWASTKAQIVKQGVPTAIDFVAPKWGTGVVENVKRRAVTAVRDYAWGELFELGYSEYAKKDDDTQKSQDQLPPSLWQEVRDGQGGECNISINLASWRDYFADTGASVSDAICHKEFGKSSDHDIFQVFDVCENVGHGGAKSGSKIIYRTMVGKVDDDRFLVKEHVRSISSSRDSGYEDWDSYEVARCRE